jgi:hypothetical protein
MTFYEEIQQLATKCTAQQISIREFREQFVPLLLGLNRRTDTDAVTLADTIENLYADVLIGALTEDEFRRKLAQFTPFYAIQFEWGFQSTATAASSADEPALKTPTLESSSNPQLLQLCASAS